MGGPKHSKKSTKYKLNSWSLSAGRIIDPDMYLGAKAHFSSSAGAQNFLFLLFYSPPSCLFPFSIVVSDSLGLRRDRQHEPMPWDYSQRGHLSGPPARQFGCLVPANKKKAARRVSSGFERLAAHKGEKAPLRRRIHTVRISPQHTAENVCYNRVFPRKEPSSFGEGARKKMDNRQIRPRRRSPGSAWNPCGWGQLIEFVDRGDTAFGTRHFPDVSTRPCKRASKRPVLLHVPRALALSKNIIPCGGCANACPSLGHASR
ncbi:hypothetical protein MAPG_01746 [Magnaporthiopsis poae ATCC 64411]|uniref:Uncharacterized protein n=1 Tax=Magnaporthiopsis poae (strain ATCC 64411 / 73-15) TaxID=644358 RepID=A0A0C4DPH9_MAGP6|nr:hypothetical protein MAPG_01746 [Magnaporthiopsis poae ATCC 64411]